MATDTVKTAAREDNADQVKDLWEAHQAVYGLHHEAIEISALAFTCGRDSEIDEECSNAWRAVGRLAQELADKMEALSDRFARSHTAQKYAEGGIATFPGGGAR